MTDINVSPFTNLNYNIDFEFVSFSLLPKYYRYLNNFRILQVFAKELQMYYDNKLMLDRARLMQDCYATNQTASINRYINNYFGVSGIQIVNAQQFINDLYIYKIGEIGDTTNENTYLYNRGEIIEFDTMIDFPSVGDITKIYKTLDTSMSYKYDDITSLYVAIDDTIGNTYVYTKAELVSATDFTVFIPSVVITVGISIDQIKAIVDKFKPLGTMYNIEVV